MNAILRHRGVTSSSEGFVGLSPQLHALSDSIDRHFLQLASRFGAAQQTFSPLLPVDELRRLDYFSAFPHLVFFPASAARDQGTLEQFAAANAAGTTGALAIGKIAPVQWVLAPAACYAVYIDLQDQVLPAPAHRLTVRGTCFRAETSFAPLVRQPSFSMREIVHIGTAASVREFLREARDAACALAASWGLSPAIEPASDPFFDPARSPRYLHARLFPSKHEFVVDGIALGSLNDHRNFFGEAFAIEVEGQAAHTACLAFGIERWLHALLQRYGSAEAAQRAMSSEGVRT